MRTDPSELSVAARARRDQITGAAAAVVAEVGYANASTARIAERAGISKGVITYHFASKDEIMRLIALRLFERCAAEVDARIADAASARERVRAWIGAELEFFAAHRVEYLAMTEIMANHRDPGFSHAFEEEVAAETERMATILVHGQNSGELRAFDAASVAHIILRCKDSVLSSWAQSSDHDLTAHTETLLDFIDHAICGRLTAASEAT